MDCIIYGLPLSAKEFLNRAFTEAMGEDMVNIVEVDSSVLRQRVRLASKSPSIVLVVLDGVAAGKCADIEDGLFTSDKYLEYSTDEALVEFLNNHFGVSLEIKTEEDMKIDYEGGSSVNDTLIEQLREQVRDRDSLIESLQLQVRELKEELEDADLGISNSVTGELNDQIEMLRKENLDLRSQNSDLVAAKKLAEDQEQNMRGVLEVLSKENEINKTKANQASADYNAISLEVEQLRIKSSKLQGDLNIKNSEIQELKLSSSGSEELSEQIKELEKQVSSLKITRDALQSERDNLSAENGRLKIEVKTLKDSYAGEKASESAEIETLKGTIKQLELDKVEQNKKLDEYKHMASKSKESSDEAERLENKLLAAQDEISSLKEKIAKFDSQFTTLNEELIRAKSKAEMLETSTSRDTDVEAMYQENNNLRNQYSELSQSVFGRLREYSSPQSSTMIDIIHGGDKYKNIRFVFSGSTESRKGTYRALLDEFKSLPSNENVVIVDATAETCIDYVFEIQKVQKGLNWFIKGGGIMPFLSSTCLPNVKVLSPGLGYINDVYFLTVDWERRLKDLENSGFNVVLYCGDISSVVGRVLHETFANRGSSMIYIHGNAVGARTLITNIKGISNSHESSICYFEYNKKVEKFYEMVSKEGYDCRVISMV